MAGAAAHNLYWATQRRRGPIHRRLSLKAAGPSGWPGRSARQMRPANRLPAILTGWSARYFPGSVRPSRKPVAPLADMVTMTIFITDARYGDRFTQLRKEIFGDNFPASALITVAVLARPEMLVEVQGIAVLG
jgi:hypothetical protein